MSLTFIRYALRLPDEPSRVFLASCLSLLPGTVSVSLRGQRLTLHVLDRSRPVLAATRALAERVADLFGVPLQRR